MRAKSIAPCGVALFAIVLGLVGCDKHPMSPNGTVALSTLEKKPGSPAGGGDCGGLPVAPESQRVDLYTPVFSNPIRVTNPLFPIGQLDRVLLLGTSDGEPLRVETTLLARTQTIDLDGQPVEALVSQYVAWLDRRILEVALDWYVQDDLGAVWYLGEDVFNYEDGIIADTDGTWLAGRDGPAAMIMPANPQVGNVWRPENICGFVFEEVAAAQVGVTVNGPRGPVSGAIVTDELHMDGTHEDKFFAPGYGEFSTGSGGDLEAVALAVPTDALAGPVPSELEALSSGAAQIFRAVGKKRWGVVSGAVDAMTAAWTAYRAGGVPPMLEERMNTAIAALVEAAGALEPAETRQASIDVALAALDFRLAHQPRREIDLALIDVWARQLVVDAQSHDRGAVRGDVATIKWIRQRLERDCPADVDARLQDLLASAGSADWSVASGSAEKLQESLIRYVGTGDDLTVMR